MYLVFLHVRALSLILDPLLGRPCSFIQYLMSASLVFHMSEVLSHFSTLHQQNMNLICYDQGCRLFKKTPFMPWTQIFSAKKIISLSSLDLGIFLPYLDMVVYVHQIVVMKYLKVITFVSSVLFRFLLIMYARKSGFPNV